MEAFKKHILQTKNFFSQCGTFGCAKIYQFCFGDELREVTEPGTYEQTTGLIKKKGAEPPQREYVGNQEAYGKLHFGARYDDQTKTLTVTIVSAENLPARKDGSAPSCFVEARVLGYEPGKTPQAANTTNPVFNENMQMIITQEDAQEKKLELTIYDKIFDTVTAEVKEDVVSTIRIALSHLDLSNLSYDICYIPLLRTSLREPLDKGRASLLNSQISSTAAQIYRQKIDTQELNTELSNQHQVLHSNEEERRSTMAAVARMHSIARRSSMDDDDAEDHVDSPNNDNLGNLKKILSNQNNNIGSMERFITSLEEEMKFREPEIYVGLEYKRIHMKLVISIYAAADLPKVSKSCDPYVTLSITGRKGKPLESAEVAPVQFNNFNPNWTNAIKVLENVDKNELENLGVVVGVMDHNKLRANTPIGTVRLGKGHLHDQGHWEEMMAKREVVKKWHRISLR